MASQLANAFGAPRLLVGAREAGAGSLIELFLEGRAVDETLLALIESPADRYFAGHADRVQVLAAGRSPGQLFDAARKAVEAHLPDQVIVGASAGFTIEKALIEVAREAGIPVLSVVDHYWNLWQRFAGESPADRWRYRPDLIAVPDSWCRNRLRELGCPVDTIVTFEHPLLWSQPAPAVPALNKEVRARLGIAEDALVVMFVSEYGFADTEGWEWDQAKEEDIYLAADELVAQIQAVAAATARTIKFMIRPHPAETHDWEAFAARHELGLVLLGRNLAKQELFAAADIAFGLNSMLLAEVGRAGVPSYSWFPDQSYEGLRLSQFAGWVKQCLSAAECGDAIRALA